MNENHPLIEALNRPRPSHYQTITVPLEDCGIGDAVELSILGVVKSVAKDGKYVVEVQKVEEESDDDSSEQEQPEVTMTQDSHSPS